MRNGTGVYQLPANNPVISGQTISSTAFNNTMTDIGNALSTSIASDGQTSITADLPMSNHRHTGVSDAQAVTDYASAGQVQNNTLTNLTTIAGTNTITAVAPLGMSAYATGQQFALIATGANTGAVTLNINGIGAKAITKNGTVALSSGDIVSGVAYQVIYDGTQFQLINGTITSDKIANNAITSAKMANGGAEFGMRNRLINAQGLINQRGYVSGTATGGANQYTVDRWRVVTSGQNLTFTTTNNVITFTAPAGGVEQVIEGLNLESGTYVLSWTGTATATVGGTSVANGGTISVIGGTNTTVKFSSGTFTQPQFEKGSTATSFDYRPYGSELALCQRYYQTIGYGFASFPVIVAGYSATTSSVGQIKHIVSMRAAPTFSVTGSIEGLDNTLGPVVVTATLSTASTEATRLGLTHASLTANAAREYRTVTTTSSVNLTAEL